MGKHHVEKVPYDDGSGFHYGCIKCGLFMGGINEYWDRVEYEDGECPEEPIEELVVKGFREFFISPDFGGEIRDTIRRLYGGTAPLSSAEKVTQAGFEEDFGPCLAIKFGPRGDFEAVTERFIVQVHVYDGSEYLECVERMPEWFKEFNA